MPNKYVQPLHCIVWCTNHSITMKINYLHFQWKHFCSAVHLIYDSPAPLSILGTSCWCNFHTVAVKSRVAWKEKNGIDTDFLLCFNLIHVSFPFGVRPQIRIVYVVRIQCCTQRWQDQYSSSSQTSSHKDGLLFAIATLTLNLTHQYN